MKFISIRMLNTVVNASINCFGFFFIPNSISKQMPKDGYISVIKLGIEPLLIIVETTFVK